MAEAAVNPKTNEAAAAYERGCAAQMAGNIELALREWRLALDIAPRHAQASYNIAVALVILGDEDGAVMAYEHLLALYPTHREALFNLGNLRKRQGRVEEARATYKHLLDAWPEYVSAWINLAKTYADCGDYAEAAPLLEHALEIDPQNAYARWNYSHILLRKGEWEEGWREYEARRELPQWVRSPVDAPAWDGSDKAQKLLLWNDQGIGDAIQFFRYACILAERGHEISIFAQDSVQRLAASVDGVTRAVGPLAPLPHADAQAPLTSVPHLAAIPEPVWRGPYVHRQKMDLPKRAGKRAVGIVWAGNRRHAGNEARSTKLADLSALFEVEGIDWFSLQVGPDQAQIGEYGLGNKICDLAPRLTDFAETASAVAALDLVITVDTAVTHVAGAVGVACWVMLPVICDWRWGDEGEACAWYPQTRVIRQTHAGDWREVAARIAKKLKSA